MSTKQWVLRIRGRIFRWSQIWTKEKNFFQTENCPCGRIQQLIATRGRVMLWKQWKILVFNKTEKKILHNTVIMKQCDAFGFRTVLFRIFRQQLGNSMKSQVGSQYVDCSPQFPVIILNQLSHLSFFQFQFSFLLFRFLRSFFLGICNPSLLLSFLFSLFTNNLLFSSL